jgi:hypothetical protein
MWPGCVPRAELALRTDTPMRYLTIRSLPMDNASTTSQRIDLMRQMDVAYWCRIFDVTIEQLREAVHHAGHQVQEVQRYLQHKAGSAG